MNGDLGCGGVGLVRGRPRPAGRRRLRGKALSLSPLPSSYPMTTAGTPAERRAQMAATDSKDREKESS